MEKYNIKEVSENMNDKIAMSRRKKSRHTPKNVVDAKRWGKDNPPRNTDEPLGPVKTVTPPPVPRQQILPPFAEEEKPVPILVQCQDLMIYSSARVWALLHAAGTDHTKIGLIHANLEVYYRYTSITPQGNWRRAIIIGSAYEGTVGRDAVLTTEVQVEFPSNFFTYHIKEDRQGIDTLVFIDKKHKQPVIIPPYTPTTPKTEPIKSLA